VVKILSQAGFSLADVYEVEGSILSIDQLDVTEIKAVHDLGPQIHSERLLSILIQQNTGAILQNVTWNLTTGNFPDSVARIFGVSLIADVTSRIDNVVLAIQDPDTGREMPFFVWDSNADADLTMRWSNNGAAVAGFRSLRPAVGFSLPTLLTRMGGTRGMPLVSFRGTTLGFGAGTVTCFLVYHLARPNRISPTPGDPSSHGLPIPSW